MDWTLKRWREERVISPLVQEPIVQAGSTLEAKLGTPWTALLLAAFSILGIAASLVEYLRRNTAFALTAIVVWTVILVILIVLQPRTSSLMLIILYLAVTVCQAIPFAYPMNQHSRAIYWEIASVVLSIISLATVVRMQLRHPLLPRDGISRPFTSPTVELRSPEDNLTMWQWMTVSWMAPLIERGRKSQLNDEDVWQLPYEFQHNPLHDAFSSLSGTVVARLLKANWLDLFLLTLLAGVDLAANYSVPVITRRLLQAMQDIDRYKSPAMGWAVLILVAEIVTAQSAVFGTWFGRRTYERTRGALIMMIHEKVLHRKVIGGKLQDESEKEGDGKLTSSQSNGLPINDDNENTPEDSQDTEPVNGSRSTISRWWKIVKSAIGKIQQYLPFQKKSTPDAKQPASVGKIYNLMRYDAYEVAQRFWEFQTLVTAPVGLVISLVLVWRMIGWPSLVGITVVVVAQLINGFLARGLLKNEVKRRKATDDKLQQITQYIEAIRHLRWYGWHMRKIESVFTARQKELNFRIISFFWGNAIVFINIFASGLLPVAAFWAYTTLAGWELTVDIAFPALQLFVLLQQNLREIPNLITVLLNAAVALRRIEDFMVEPDVEPKSSSEVGDVLELRKASFSWPGVEDTVLRQISLTFPPGLTTIIGQVASGKTALLQALLGELDLQEGKLIRPDAPIGYCAQTPWLESMSIRDNILFCSPYDEQRYKHVIEACALLPDLASFQQGDLSPIGENGIGLSGGQKARVALARAIYSQSTILLLDDPLSALDQQTAEWIVAKCFSGSLVKDRTVLLVTHRTDLCQGISQQIVEMSEGTARLHTDTSAVIDGPLHLTKTESPNEEFKKAQESAAIKDKFEDEEYRAHGGVKWQVYWEYIAAGKLRWWFGTICLLLIWRLCDYAQSWFLKEWGEAYKTIQAHSLLLLQSVVTRISQGSPLSRFFDRFPRPAENPKPWLTGFATIVIFQSLAYLLAQLMMIVVTYTAAKRMFRQIMLTISSATFRFYDVTPAGRLMNRLTGDMGTIDGAIAGVLVNFAWTFIAWITSLAVIAAVTPLFTVISLALAAGFVYVFNHFLPTSQSLRRLETVSLSPLMSNFGALLNGLVTVRAFHAQFQFHNRVVATMDKFQLMDHFYWSLQTWLTYRFQVLSAVSSLVLTLIAIYSGFTAGLTAFVLVAAQRFVQATQGLCKQYGTIQLDFVSVERVVELVHLDQEDPGEKQPPAYWPLLSSKNPAVEFENVTIRYAPELDPALQNISFSIPSGSSTAIIGRTGSGKSTLALALLATIKADSGRIFVDGLDVSQVSKQDLRTRVTFLAQDPILFEGSIRTNLDPMDDYSDEECLSVLQRIHGDTKYQWALETSVETGGRNLSQGQRQLVGLARAMLRRSAIIIMDEATASVDLETSWEIQRVLKEELAGSTVITIAHRASAVRDCDLVIKLDKGSLSAFGTPAEVEVGVAVDPSVGDETLIATETGESSSSRDSQPRTKSQASENVQEQAQLATQSTMQNASGVREEHNNQNPLEESESSAVNTAEVDTAQNQSHTSQVTEERNASLEATLREETSSNDQTDSRTYSEVVKQSSNTEHTNTSTSHSAGDQTAEQGDESSSVTNTTAVTEEQTQSRRETTESVEGSTARRGSGRRASRSSDNDDMVIF